MVWEAARLVKNALLQIRALVFGLSFLNRVVSRIPKTSGLQLTVSQLQMAHAIVNVAIIRLYSYKRVVEDAQPPQHIP